MLNNLYSNQLYGANLGAQQIVRVNGEAGARSYQLPPNSSALLLDETAPLVWLIQSDGAGYKSATAYKIEPYTPEPAPDLKNILTRIAALEEKINGKQPDFINDK